MRKKAQEYDQSNENRIPFASDGFHAHIAIGASGPVEKVIGVLGRFNGLKAVKKNYPSR